DRVLIADRRDRNAWLVRLAPKEEPRVLLLRFGSRFGAGPGESAARDEARRRADDPRRRGPIEIEAARLVAGPFAKLMGRRAGAFEEILRLGSDAEDLASFLSRERDVKGHGGTRDDRESAVPGAQARSRIAMRAMARSDRDEDERGRSDEPRGQERPSGSAPTAQYG